MISNFLSLNIIEQFLAGFIFLLFFFIFIVELRVFARRLAKRGDKWVEIANVIFYPFGVLFIICDVLFNVIYMPLVFFQLSNKFGEGWTVTARVSYHKRQKGIYLQKSLSLFICDRFLEPVDKGHCS